ncbi:hypothetical protein K501DRAFT_6529, partial [Backusella circina FSU 941]
MTENFNNLEELQRLAKESSENNEKAYTLEAENKELRLQLETLQAANSGTIGRREDKNYKMQNMTLRALQQQSKKTITMLQDSLREKTELLERYENGTPERLTSHSGEPAIIVGDAWKASGKGDAAISPLYPIPYQLPNANDYYNFNNMPHSPRQQNASQLGPGGFIMPGTGFPSMPDFNNPQYNQQQRYPNQPWSSPSMPSLGSGSIVSEEHDSIDKPISDQVPPTLPEHMKEAQPKTSDSSNTPLTATEGAPPPPPPPPP